MSASSHLKRIKWRQAYRDSVAESVTFAAKLNAIEDSIADEVEGGKDVSSTTTAQRSVSFFKSIEPQDRAALILELQDIYTEARANLIAGSPSIPSPTDLQIKNEGDEYLKPADDIETDFSGLREGRAALV